jgi:hypothetical protein
VVQAKFSDISGIVNVREDHPMRKHILVAVTLAALSSPAGAETNAQQQRMKDCNVQATGMTGAARKEFMSTCLGGTSASTKKPHCVNGKPCGNSCIAKDKLCHQ